MIIYAILAVSVFYFDHPTKYKMADSETTQYLSEIWRESGVANGDTVLLHSNIIRTVRQLKRRGIKAGPELLLDSFIEAVGNKGTLVFPLFNFDFPKTAFFDIRNTPSQMGNLTEVARLHSQSIRTGHPIYSFAAIGYQSSRFAGVDNKSGYGEDSPFAIIREMNGKIAVLDLPDQNSMTFYHHVEELHGVDYRYFKEFSGTYVQQDGTRQQKTYKLFVRDLERGVRTDVNPAGEMMWSAGLYQGNRPGVGNGLRTVSAVQMYDFISEIINSGRSLGALYSIGEDI